ncbi:hypothetical protein Pla110_03320 [Polystyrenella longa]|uniref:Uncharacterized protein n=1 Tax=Polystyrenella longa TaxID=2528007 RepID=A0A518CHC0_9PLAN|nr:hypothetical protein Pla110_03320 [Polystyrenella longa]
MFYKYCVEANESPIVFPSTRDVVLACYSSGFKLGHYHICNPLLAVRGGSKDTFCIYLI